MITTLNSYEFNNVPHLNAQGYSEGSRLIYERHGKMNPKFTIAIPTYKRGKLLKNALRSAIQQKTSFPFEVIVIDNDPGDDEFIHRDLCELLLVNRENVSFRYYRNIENFGMFGNWNRCIYFSSNSSGWLTILNDDDELLDHFMDEVRGIVISREKIDLVRFQSFVKDRRSSTSNWAEPITNSKVLKVDQEKFFWGNSWLGVLGVLYRKEEVLSVGGFLEKDYPSSDYLMHVRMLNNGASCLEIFRTVAVYGVEHNESIRPQVLAGFVRNGYQLRMALARTYRFNMLYKLYAWLLIGAHYYDLKKKWNTEFLDQLKTDSAIRSLPSGIFRYKNFFLCRALCKVIRELNKV